MIDDGDTGPPEPGDTAFEENTGWDVSKGDNTAGADIAKEDIAKGEREGEGTKGAEIVKREDAGEDVTKGEGADGAAGEMDCAWPNSQI